MICSRCRLFGMRTTRGLDLSISLQLLMQTWIVSLSLSITIGMRTPPSTVQVIAFGYMDARSSWSNTRLVVALE